MSTFPDSAARGLTSRHPVLKGFVEVEGRLVHYVRRGVGPALVLLHAAPCSSKVMAPLQALWGDDFTTFAFDLPGFGQSDMIEVDRLETHHLADSIAGAVRALGLTKVALYGRHTGAGVAVEMARRHPDLCSFVLTDGYPVFAAPYSEERLREYLPPIIPQADGGHLTWTWFRYREQHLFWPWDRPLAAHRADTDAPDDGFLHRGTVELLEAAPNYQRVYASAFRHPGLAVIGEVKVPACYGNRPGDSQYKTVKSYPANAWVKIFSRDALEAAAEELAVLKEHARSGPAPDWRSRIGSGPATRDYVATPQGPVHVRTAGFTGGARPLVLLHDLPGALDLHGDMIEALAAARPVVAFDLFGNGLSTLDAAQEVSVDLWVAQAEAVLDALGLSDVDLLAMGMSACVAAALRARRPDLVRAIVFRSPPACPGLSGDFARAYAPDIAPSWEGAHVLRLWRHLRDQELWWPWNKPVIANKRTSEPRLAPEDLHRRALALLRQPHHYSAIWRAVLDAPLAAEATTGLVIQPQDLFAFAATDAERLFGVAAIHAADEAGAAQAALKAFAAFQ